MELKRSALPLTAAVLLLILLSAVSLVTGSYSLSFREVFSVPDSLSARVFFDLRLPRTVCGILCGASLGLTGAVYQTVFASPLASPDLTGVASGSSVGAAAAIVLGSGGALLRMTGSFVCGMLSLLLVLAIVKAARGERNVTYILAGILVSSLGEAGLMLLKTAADPERELAALEFWTMGSLAAVKADKTLALTAVCVPALILLLVFRRPAIVLSLGDDEMRNTGLSPSFWRAVLLTCSTLAVSSSVAAAGAVGFVGLTAPHIARLLHPLTDGRFFVLSLLVGADLLTAADLLARTLSPMAELPLSVFTAAFASPVLLGLLIRRKGGE